MYMSLYDKLSDISKVYREIEETGITIYTYLKEKKLHDIQPLHVLQLKKTEELKEKQQVFEQLLIQYCSDKNIEKPNVKQLFPYFTEQEAKQMQELLEETTQAERAAKQISTKNQHYLQVLITTTEAMVDCISELNMERNHNSQMFMNELL
ncbi:MAG: hypothetical protein ACE3JP_01500 [Ectobacillus sp.]